MNNTVRMFIIAGAAIALSSCGKASKEAGPFTYTVDQFADLKVMRYQIPGWEDLTLKQKEYAYHLAEAAKYGRDILWDQNCKDNLRVRHAVEKILDSYKGDRNNTEFENFKVYAKRLFFSNGIHHHYAEDKFFPECPREYFASLLENVGIADEGLLDVIYDPTIYPQRRSTSTDGDIVKNSAVNFYEGVTREEVENYYAGIIDPNDPEPISYGLNTKVVKGEDGVIRELPWKVGGIYSPALEKICVELEKAAEVAENDIQKKALGILVEYYKTGDLRKWDEFNIEWVKDTIGTVDFINGFIEDYNDPLGRKASWEGYVNIKDAAASARTEILSANAQWFEDNSPVDPRFKKKTVKGVSAKVINAVCLAGDSYPSTPIGINLPNADWIRKEHGSKSVTISNITHTYDLSAQEQPNSTLNEFAFDENEIALAKKFGGIADEIHTDLHECLGHASGQLLPGVSTTAMGEYASALEEARADLFGLYYSADPKMVELGIMPDPEAYKAEYSNYIRNGLMVQFTRVELGRPNTEAHMQNRKLIAEWCYEKGAKDNVIEKKVKDGKTYFVVNDYVKLRGLFAELLAEIQRIKSEGDYKAGKNLIETYAVHIDPELHKEVKARYEALNLKPYGGFINPEIVPVVKGGKTVDYKVVYTDDYLGQMLEYGKKYGTL
ncbi:MAG: dihydrofolate reductase [Bacteroidales bacterium]|nr:dihydrofolate reductase [Bacteroidales bacterium]MBQ1842085.1 dihydrofolate reductase [Bacteroidales bacterium]MBQ3846841.1 dihydrofolate reductase [Bacteroidales bacterium]